MSRTPAVFAVLLGLVLALAPWARCAETPSDVVRATCASAREGCYWKCFQALSSVAAHNHTVDNTRQTWDQVTHHGDLERIRILHEEVGKSHARITLRLYYTTEFKGPTGWGETRRSNALDATMDLVLEDGHWKLELPHPENWTVVYPRDDA